MIWALGPEEGSECGRRFILLVLSDLDEQTKAAATLESRTELKSRRDEIFGHFGLSSRTFRPPRYLDMIRYVADFLRAGADAASSPTATEVERLWRSTAGAAHGKHWPEFEFHDHVDAGDGLFVSAPRVEAITDVLRVADTYVRAGVVLFAIRAGREQDLERLWEDATDRLNQRLHRES